MLWLTLVNTKWTPAMFDEAQQFLAAIGPSKRSVNQSVVEQAHARGLNVVPYTCTSSDKQDFEDVGEEMRHYLYTLGVDGVFTDNPDRFPRANGSDNKAKSS
jgi:glycerophosphoryl diester phosphodiesterase